MIKKILTIFLTILLSFGFYNIQATTSDVVDAEPLEQLVAINFKMQTEDELIEEWRPIGLNKYTLGGKVFYRTSGSTSNIPIQNELDNVVVFRIIKHGYNKIGGDKLGLKSENDAYMATQLAIDYTEKYFDLSEINNTYQVADKLTETQMIRGAKIVEKAKELIDIGLNSGEIYNSKAELLEVGEMQKEEEYVSQTYKTQITNGKLLGYNIENSKDYSTANAKTGEMKVEFNAEEELFKVMIPNNHVKDIDSLNINAKISYLTDKMYERADRIGRYAMLSEVEETKDVEVVLANEMRDEYLGEENPEQKPNTGTAGTDKKEESGTNNTDKNENNKDNIDEKNKVQNQETKVEENQETSANKEEAKAKVNTEENEIQRKILPRTGADYFNFKLVLINLSLFAIFLGIKYIVSKNKLKTKKQTT